MMFRSKINLIMLFWRFRYLFSGKGGVDVVSLKFMINIFYGFIRGRKCGFIFRIPPAPAPSRHHATRFFPVALRPKQR